MLLFLSVALAAVGVVLIFVGDPLGAAAGLLAVFMSVVAAVGFMLESALDRQTDMIQEAAEAIAAAIAAGEDQQSE